MHLNSVQTQSAPVLQERLPYADSMTPVISTCAPLKYCGVLTSHGHPVAVRNPTAGFHLGTGTSSKIRGVRHRLEDPHPQESEEDNPCEALDKRRSVFCLRHQ
ncbi:hypothetical protein TNCV_246971 [Trichonephila clavipes]|nr:hypothetical protein TNCV_246971 [Trichonephila clavipes]